MLSTESYKFTGFLFKSYPSLMTTKESAEIMDKVFASGELESRAHLLRIINSFLLSEMAKHTAAEKGNFLFKAFLSVHTPDCTESQAKKVQLSTVNMEELVGNTQGFADSG
jgi:cohesin loading factor subunit SCC2